uniref:Uncharacterized protein n=1 Tax=Salix viminalis TaxID=40686 RepID=A0A6N2MXL4_SALVM
MTVKLNNELEMRSLYPAASIVKLINPETISLELDWTCTNLFNTRCWNAAENEVRRHNHASKVTFHSDTGIQCRKFRAVLEYDFLADSLLEHFFPSN